MIFYWLDVLKATTCVYVMVNFHVIPYSFKFKFNRVKNDVMFRAL